MASNINFKRGTAATFYIINPILLSGEPGLETDTNKIKFGDGVTAWRDLQYANPDLETVDGGEMLLPPVPSAPGSFSPPDIEGLALWMDATHSDYIHTVGGKVSLWEDMSPERNKFVQSLKPNRPSKDDQIEGQDVVTFDGTNDGMISNFSVPEEFTLLVAFRRNGPSSAGRVVTALDSDDSNEVVLLGTQTGSSFGVSVEGAYSATQPVDNITTVVYALRSDTEGFATRLNGLNQQSGGSPIPSGLEHLCVGSSRTDFSIGAFSGDVAEIVMYDHYLSDADLADIEDYMMTRWGVIQVSHPLITGMKAFWRLNEENGDRSDINNPPVVLTEYGTVGSDSGVTENAASFTGGSNYLEAPSGFNFSGSFSASIWFKPSAVTGGYTEMIQSWGSTQQMVFLFGDEPVFGSGNELIGYIHTDTDTPRVSVSGLVAGEWHHGVLVYDEDNNVLSLYLNGALANQAATTGVLNSTSQPVRIGIGEQTSRPNDLNFLADQVGFWDRALSAEDVEMLYNQGLGKEDFAADLYGDNVSLLLHMDRPANVVATTTTSSGGGDPYFENVSLLLKFEGNFSDSANNFTFESLDGTATITGSPAKFGQAGDLTTAQLLSNEQINIATGEDFTIELWNYSEFCRFEGASPQPAILSIDPNDGTCNQPSIAIFAHDNSRNLFLANNVYVTQGFHAVSPPCNVWQHIAIVRQNGTIHVYLDGVDVEQAAYSAAVIGYVRIFPKTYLGDPAGLAHFGYIDDLRITKGVARYTENFTPPTSAFQTGARPASLLLHFDPQDEPEATLLLHFDGGFGDSSPNGFSVTPNGNAVISSDQSRFGGASVYFDGLSDTHISLTLPNGFSFSDSDFTVEAWIYPTESQAPRNIFGRRAWDESEWGFSLDLYQGKTHLFASSSGYSVDIDQLGNQTVELNQWSHVALVRQGAQFSVYLNGVLDLQNTMATLHNPAADFTIGGSVPTQLFLGYIDELRIVKGVARYTSDFTPPSAPFLADPHSANVSLLMHFDGDLSDSSQNALTVTANGNATTSTAQSKFGGASGYFDGNGDYLEFPGIGFDASSGDWTIEAWIRPESITSSFPIVTGSNRDFYYAYVYENGSLLLIVGDGVVNQIIDARTDTPPAQTWWHVALVRSGGSMYAYENGVLVSQTSEACKSSLLTSMEIGSDIGFAVFSHGYIDDLRITKGVARYTGDFTPPAHAFPNPEVTPAFDSGKNALTVTANGNAKVTGNNSRFGGSSGYVTGDGSTYFSVDTGNISIAEGEDFTAEAWIYRNSNAYNYEEIFWFNDGLSDSQNFFGLYAQDGSRQFMVFARVNGSFNYVCPGQAGSIPLNQWVHVAVTRSNNIVRTFIDGTLNETSGEYNNSISGFLRIGGASTNGYIDDFRIVKGVALYTESFTPPTAPLEPVIGSAIDPNFSDVSLLLHMDGADGSTTFTDSSGNAMAVTANGNAAASTAQSRFGGSSLHIGDNGDWISMPYSPALDFLTDDFTIEFWFYFIDGGRDIWLMGGAWDQDCGILNSAMLVAITDGNIGLQRMCVGWGAYAPFSPANSQWQHIAMCRQSGTTRFFVDGVKIGESADNNSYNIDPAGFDVGIHANPSKEQWGVWGNYYIDDLRITKGVARYTKDFALPSYPFWSSDGGSSTTTTQPAVFIDTSIHTHEVTPSAGDVYLNTTDLQYGNASGEFAGGHLSVPMSPEFAFGTGDFTVEFWGSLTYAQYSAVFSTAPTSQEAGTYLIGFRNDANMFGFCYDVPGFNFASANIAAYYGMWTHYAFVRYNGTLKMYVNGSEVATAEATQDLDGGTATTAVLGRRWTDVDANYLSGLIDDFRITKGVARYKSDFNPPSKAYPDPVIATVPVAASDPYGEYVTLLLHMDEAGGFLDNSYMANEVVANGSATISTAQSKFGGASGYFDGDTAYLSIPATAEIDISSCDFTMECWVYPLSLGGNIPQAIFHNSENDYAGLVIGAQMFGNAYSFDLLMGDGWAVQVPGDNALVNNQWQHIAAVRFGNEYRLFVNGAIVASGTNSYNAPSFNEDATIGRFRSTQTLAWDGYIDDFRITKGVARYTANFTPPTLPFPSPFQPAWQASLLMHFDGDFSDSSGNGLAVTANGNATISTEQSKWGGSSLEISNSNAGYLTIPDNSIFDFGTGDFTVECWVRLTQPSDVGSLVGGSALMPGSFYFLLEYTTLKMGVQAVGAQLSAAHTLTTNNTQWHHIAASRQNGTLRLFQDGIKIGEQEGNTTIYEIASGDQMCVGFAQNPSQYNMNGYIDDLRIVKGTALYTSDFTPPASPLRHVPPVAPGDITGCDLWLDSTGDINVVNGSIASWSDKSGNNRTATGADYAPTPIVATAAGPGGQDVVRFAGDPNVLKVPYNFNLKNSSGLVVFGTTPDLDCNTCRGGRLLSFQPASGFDWTQADGMVLHQNINEGCSSYINSINLYNQGPSTSAYQSCPMPWMVIAYTIDAEGNALLRVNGSEGEVQFSGIADTAGPELLIGFGGDFGPVSALIGDVAEVALFDHALSPLALEALERGAIARWFPEGLTPDLLLHFDGADGSTTFRDSSPYKRVVTANGDAVISTAQSRFGGSSGDFSPGGYLSLSSYCSTFGADDFTIEAWVYPLAFDSYQRVFSYQGNSIGGTIVHLASGNVRWALVGGAEILGSTTLNLNEWSHIAVTRQSGTVRVFVNGIVDASGSEPGTIYEDGVSIATIGASNLFGEQFNGYIDELRVVKGKAMYTGNFTPPDMPFGAKTSLLMHFDGDFSDSSGNGLTVAANGNAAISASQSRFGGSSGHFDSGSGGSCLETTPSQSMVLGSDDFTIEFWVYHTDVSKSEAYWIRTDTGTAQEGVILGLGGGVLASSNGSGWDIVNSGDVFRDHIVLGQWQHIALTRGGNDWRAFVNGSQVWSGSAAGTIAQPAGGAIRIGDANSLEVSGGAIGFDGYIDELRVVKGYAAYTSNFTSPDLPFGATLSLLLHMDGSDGSTAFVDNSPEARTLSYEGNVQISTSQSRFGGSSLYQPQSGGSVMVPYSPSLDLGTGDFTIEFWYYPVSLFALGSSVIQGGGNPGEPGGDWCSPVQTYLVAINDNGTTFGIGRNCVGFDASATVSLTTGSWHHMAVTRQGGLVRFFQDGVLMGSGVSNQNYLTQQTYGLRICDPLQSTIDYGDPYGVSLDGYVDEVRIVKGSALYTDNFTPPTGPFSP